jgi:hypothetical protein
VVVVVAEVKLIAVSSLSCDAGVALTTPALTSLLSRGMNGKVASTERTYVD